ELVTTPPARGRPPPAHGYPLSALLEGSGGDAPGEAARLALACEQAMAAGLIVDAAIAQSQAEAAAIWALRDDVGQCLRHGRPFTYDISLPIESMPGYLDIVRPAIAERFPRQRTWVFGHLGDGNLHLVSFTEDDSPQARADADAIIYRPLQALGGSVSAEHGIGFEKKDWLGISRSPQEIELMRSLKHCLDPLGILNPGRIFAS
ncbi:MAG: FAD-linked oxidase C-terminal domain-containing protein, partial [Burkholderiaceae bacterium]